MKLEVDLKTDDTEKLESLTRFYEGSSSEVLIQLIKNEYYELKKLDWV